jgi:hypothetical protein
LNRLLVGIVLLGAAAFLDPLDLPHLVGYLAGACGVVAVHERLRHDFSPAGSTLTTLVLFLATSLFWSMTRARSPFDALSFGIVAVLWLSTRRPGTRRSQIATWAVLAALPMLMRVMLVPPATGAAADVPSPFDGLYSSSRGLFSLTPVVYLAAAGLCLYARRLPVEATASVAIVGMWLATATLTPRPSDHDPFGHGLTPALVLVAPGLASIVDYARAKPLVAIAPLVAGAVLWNYWLMVQYTAGTLPKDAPISFAAMVRQQADVHTRPPYIYPFAMPANLWFAWRERVPSDRYEVLSRVPRRSEFELTFDRRADPFLLDGFGGAGSTAAGPVRWTSGRRASMAIPLAPPASALVLDLIALARGEEPAVAVDLTIEINGHEIGRLIATPTVESPQTLTIPAADVGRILRAGYNRLTIVNRGIQRIDASDQRPLGPLAARSGDVAYPVAIHKIRIAPAT